MQPLPCRELTPGRTGLAAPRFAALALAAVLAPLAGRSQDLLGEPASSLAPGEHRPAADDLLGRGAPELEAPAAELDPKAAQPAGAYAGDFRVTYYWIAVEDARFLGLPRSAVLLADDGSEIARVAESYRRELDREGTGRLRDGRVVNVAFRAGKEWRYRVLSPGSWGSGVAGFDLAPFVCVAADPESLAPGTRLYLPALSGLPLPDGSRHAGEVVVADRGSAIRGARLDVFIGDRSWLPIFEGRVPSHAETPVLLLAREALEPGDCYPGLARELASVPGESR